VIRGHCPLPQYRASGTEYVDLGEGPPCDWWWYEDVRRPMVRTAAAAGYPSEEVGQTGITFDDMRPGC
jgi:hypothetical protein